MKEIKKASQFEVWQKVIYVPSHVQLRERSKNDPENEIWYVSSIREWVELFIRVKFKWPTGEKCDVQDIFTY